MAVDATTADHLLKTLYPKKTSIVTFKEHPFLAMLPKKTDFTGRNKVIDLIYAETQGRSATFANAKNSGSHKGVNFTLTTVEDYSTVLIPRKLMKQAGDNKGAIVDLFQTEVDSAFRALGNSMATAAHGTGSGRIGQIAAGGIASAVVTLSEPADIVNFDVGMVLELSATDGGTSVRAGTITIDKVDRDAGTFTCTANVTAGIAAAAAGDYIFQAGDYGKKMLGWRAWVPDTAPTSTLFLGVDRTKDTSRLGGLRVDGSSLNHEEALIKAMVRVSRERGPAPTHCFMNPDDVGALVQILGSKKAYEDVQAGEIGFRALSVSTPKGTVKVFEDADCPKGRSLLAYMDSWCLESTGEAPEIFEDDGMKMLRAGTSDAYEVQLGYYANISNNAPAWNVNLKLAAV